MANELRLRITLVDPPDGYAFCLQRGKGGRSERLDYVEVDDAEDEDVAFELTVTVRTSKATGALDFGGPFVQGRPGQRFFYLCVGRCSAAAEPHWTGRVKVPLASITERAAAQAMGQQAALTARYAASRPAGGPALASVALLGEGWVPD